MPRWGSSITSLGQSPLTPRRYLNKESRAHARFGFEPDFTVNVKHNALDHGQPQTHSGGFGGEVGLKNSALHLLGNPLTIVRNFHHKGPLRFGDANGEQRILGI